MNHAGFVRGLKARRDLADDRHHPGNGQLGRVAQDRRQVRAFDVRHRDVLDAVDLSEVVNADDVLVGDLAGEQELLLEPALDILRPVGILRRLRANDLQRDGDVQLRVPRLIDGAHPADAELSAGSCNATRTVLKS